MCTRAVSGHVLYLGARCKRHQEVGVRRVDRGVEDVARRDLGRASSFPKTMSTGLLADASIVSVKW